MNSHSAGHKASSENKQFLQKEGKSLEPASLEALSHIYA